MTPFHTLSPSDQARILAEVCAANRNRLMATAQVVKSAIETTGVMK
jgi:hypothetical protein